MTTQETREMLELAAKAAGYEVFGDQHPYYGLNVLVGCTVYLWRPTVDNGDAFQLAVALGLTVEIYRGSKLIGNKPWVQVLGYATRRLLATEQATDNGDSLGAAARLAITRAAAEIGRAMP